MAATKARHYANLYEKLDTREGEREIYRLVKSRHRKAEDIQRFYGINNESGELLINSEKVRERWRNYFEKISSEEFPHPPIPSTSPVEGPIREIDINEVEEALKKMKLGKATGPDDIPVEFWRSKQWNSTKWLTQFFNQITKEGHVPSDWHRSTTVPIFKKKGSPAECSNYRPIRLLSHAMKVFERILDKRIREIANLTKNQAGFVKNCGTTDAIFAARLLVEKHREKNVPLHLAFLDLEKAFDRVPHDVIWLALRDHGIPEHLISWVKLLHKEPTSCVQTAAGKTNDFSITVGVHQGSTLSPLLFILVMDTVTSGLHKPIPWTLLYADDVMLAAKSRLELQHQTQLWSDRLAEYGLRLNKRKTEYMAIDPQETETISVDGVDLPRVTKFKYLGCTISDNGGVIDEVNARTQASWMKWRTTTGVTCDRRMKDHLKSKIYRTVIRPVALYGTESLPATKEVERRLSVMETKMLRWIGGVTRKDHVTNAYIRKRFGVAPIHEKMREGRLRWLGHVLRAEENTIAKSAYVLEINGKRPRGRPRHRWTDTVNKDLKTVNLQLEDAKDRKRWRRHFLIADPATHAGQR